ncbi:MAG: CoA ester lyase [Pseudomonadota bacterium]
MLRSTLFIPGDSEKKLSKAGTVGADGIIIDLEDSIAENRKPLAREMVREYLTNTDVTNTEFWIRCNPIDDPQTMLDLAAVVPAAPAGIVLPKAEGPEDVIRCSHCLDVLEAEHGVEAGSVGILSVATETAKAVFGLNAYQNVRPERLRGLTWGAEDLGSAVGASSNMTDGGEWTDPYRMVRSLCLFAAYAADTQAVDTVYVNFKDDDGLRRVCNEARRDGFTGKMAIHPAQVAIINEAFTPSAAEVEHAETVVRLFAENPEAGTIGHEGQMLDKPHLTQAERILNLAARVKAMA